MGIAVELTRVVGADTGFLLYAAGRVLDGATLYTDVIEINPPLIVALNMLPVLLSRALGIADILIYRLGTAALLVGSLLLSAAVLRRLLPEGPRVLRNGTLVLLAFVLFLRSDKDFGEREHLMLALVTPYILLAGLRASGGAVHRGLALGIGGLAGIGLALKPHFLILWLALEGYQWQQARRPLPRLGYESLAVLGVVGLYAVAIVILTPEYVHLVRFLGPLYKGFLAHPGPYLLVTAPGAAITFLALLACIALRPQARHPTLWHVLALAAAAFFMAGVLQQKGLRYHFYPSFAIATVLLGVIGLDTAWRPRSLVGRLYRTVSVAYIVSSLIITCAVNSHRLLIAWTRTPPDTRFQRLVRLVQDRADDESILVLSYHIGSAFPLVNYAGVTSASRFPQLWLLVSAYAEELRAASPLRYRTPATMAPPERYVFEATRQDWEAHRPKLLVVLRNARDASMNGLRRFDYLAYFGQDPRFAQLFAQYQLIATVGEYAVYERLEPGQRRLAPPPAATPGTQDVLRQDVVGITRLRHEPEFLLAAAVFSMTLIGLGWRERRREVV